MVPKESRILKWFGKGFFDVVKWRGRKWTYTEKFWKCLLLSKYWILLFQKRETFGAFLPFSFFLCFFFSLFSMLRLFIDDELRDFWNVWGENNFFNFLSNGMEVATPRFMKLGELQKNYRRWMHTWNGLMHGNKKKLGQASSQISWRKNHFEKFKSTIRTHLSIKLNENKSCYMEYIWLW
jgi:hypothetical protein